VENKIKGAHKKGQMEERRQMRYIIVQDTREVDNLKEIKEMKEVKEIKEVK
jgi:hypothetical protein